MDPIIGVSLRVITPCRRFYGRRQMESFQIGTLHALQRVLKRDNQRAKVRLWKGTYIERGSKSLFRSLRFFFFLSFFFFSFSPLLMSPYIATGPQLVGEFASLFPTCGGDLNTAFARDFYRSTVVPTVCNCTRTAFDNCEYQLQVSDVRCGTPYKICFKQSPDFAIGERLGDGQTVTGPGRVAVDGDVSGGGSTADACSALANAADMSGHWCVVQRGQCSDEAKVQNCLGSTSGSNTNGILGVILIDNVCSSGGSTPDGCPSTAPGVFSFPIDVPVVAISCQEGRRLSGFVGSTTFAVSKTIGPANVVQYQSPGVLTRESRTGQIFGVNGATLPTAYRFFWEPNRLLGWAFGYRAADKSVTNVALLDTSNTGEQPRVLRVWSYQELGLSFLDWSPGRLVFGQQRLGQNPQFFWILRSGSEYVFWNVTLGVNASFVGGSSIPLKGDIFINRAATRLWQQVPSPLDGKLHQWRYQEAWDISNIAVPRLLGSFALDTSLLTLQGGETTLAYPTFDSWGGSLVSFNLGDDGVGFWNYSNPTAPVLAALRDTSPSSCAPPNVGGPSGPIVPSPEPNVWVVCQPWEPRPLYVCRSGEQPLYPALQPICEPPNTTDTQARIDFLGLRVLPAIRLSDKCEDGAIVNMFWQRNNETAIGPNRCPCDRVS